MKTLRQALLTGLSYSLACGAGAIADESPTASTAALPAATVFVDKETGKLRAPTAEEQSELAALAKSDLARLRRGPASQAQIIRHANGVSSARVGLDQIEFVVATIGTDGSVQLQHATQAEPADGGAQTRSLPEK